MVSIATGSDFSFITFSHIMSKVFNGFVGNFLEQLRMGQITSFLDFGGDLNHTRTVSIATGVRFQFFFTLSHIMKNFMKGFV